LNQTLRKLSVVIASMTQSVEWLNYGLDDRHSVPAIGKDGILLFATASRPALDFRVSCMMRVRSHFTGGKATGAWSWLLTSI